MCQTKDILNTLHRQNITPSRICTKELFGNKFKGEQIKLKLFNHIPPGSVHSILVSKKNVLLPQCGSKHNQTVLSPPVPSLLVSLLQHILGQCLLYQRVGQKLGQACTSSPDH